MKTADDIKLEAKQFAVEAHCRYCAGDGFKCALDIEDMALAYIEAVHAYGEQVKEAALQECERYKFTDAGWRTDLTELKHRIRNLKLP